MKQLSFALLLTALTLNLSAQGIITYDTGDVFTSDASGPAWVAGSLMFNKIDSGAATGATQSGFSTIPNIALLTWSFDDLDLVVGESIVPGAATAGLEVYRDTDNSSNLQFFYDGDLWLTGLITEYRVEVDNNLDIEAVGTGYATITSSTVAGVGLYNEILSLTNATGDLTFAADAFASVAAGQFQSPGSISAVPEPSATAALLGLFAIAMVGNRRRARA